MTMIVMNIGGTPVYLFGCIIAAGLLAGLLLARWSTWLYEEPFAVAVDILLTAILLGLVGARVGYMLLNWPDFTLQPAEIWRLFDLRRGHRLFDHRIFYLSGEGSVSVAMARPFYTVAHLTAGFLRLQHVPFASGDRYAVTA